MTSAGNSSDGDARREICAVQGIICKRKFVDWATEKIDKPVTSANREKEEEKYEYLVQWQDEEGLTWEPRENLASVREMVRKFDVDAAEKEKLRDKRLLNIELQRKRSRKLHLKGSFEKKNKIKEVVGLRRNKFDNQVMVKIKWKPELVVQEKIHEDDDSSTLKQTENTNEPNEVNNTPKPISTEDTLDLILK